MRYRHNSQVFRVQKYNSNTKFTPRPNVNIYQTKHLLKLFNFQNFRLQILQICNMKTNLIFFNNIML